MIRLVSRLFDVIIIVLLGASPLMAQAPDSGLRGENILRRSIQQDDGFEDLKVEMEMILYNSNGDKSQRHIRTRIMEGKNDGDQLLVIFDSPRDVKNTAYLSITHLKKNDDQWLYLPALKRVKRISSSNKSGSFMGTEFAYEDLVSEEIEKYCSYRYLGDVELDRLKCHMVERVPVDAKSGYKRQIVWIDDQHFRFMKIEYYDRKNELLKTALFKDYQLYLNRYWRSEEIMMVNHQSGKRTRLICRNYQFKTGLPSRDFNPHSLQSIR